MVQIAIGIVKQSLCLKGESHSRNGEHLGNFLNKNLDAFGKLVDLRLLNLGLGLKEPVRLA
jgi:hypothetical protein